MAKVNISNVVVRENPAMFQTSFQFEITFECIEDLNDDLEWKIIYVGSAESEDYDQVLDTVVVGPIIAGKHMFVFEADAPDIGKIPKEDAVGVTVVLLTCSYNNQEFIRVGYYVNNEYADPEMKENPPIEPVFSKLQRNILATCPRVTRFKIDWGDGEGIATNENQPPAISFENAESNQMAVDGNSAPAAGGDMGPVKQATAQQSDSNSVGAILNDKSQNGLPADSEPMQM